MEMFQTKYFLLDNTSGLSQLKIGSHNVETKNMFPSTPVERYFTLVEHLNFLAQIPVVNSGFPSEIRHSGRQKVCF